MRATLTIDDDVLAAARGLAEEEGMSPGKVLSALARMGLRRQRSAATVRNGVLLLPFRADGGLVTSKMVKLLGEELEDVVRDINPDKNLPG